MGIHDRDNPLSKMILIGDLNRQQPVQIVDGTISSDESIASVQVSRPARRQRRGKSGPHSEPLDYNSLANRLRCTNRRRNQRISNLAFIKDLVGLDEMDILEENAFCLEYSQSALSSLFAEESNMLAWNKFVDMSEEQQYAVLHPKENNADISSSDCDEDFVPLNDSIDGCEPDKRAIHPCYSAESCFNRIDTYIRTALRKKHFPLGMIDWLENEIRQCFMECSYSVYESSMKTGYGRMLVHAICQYLDLVTISYSHGKVKLLNVVNENNVFNPPDLLLADYLEKNIFRSWQK